MAFAASPPRLTDQDGPLPGSQASDLDGGDTSPILLRWLVGLRWAVFLLLGATLPLGERFLDFHVRYVIAVPVMVLVVIFNAAMHARLARPVTAARVTPREVALGVAVDLVAIGALLAASGGAANPFSAVFFVHVALAASLLPARTTFGLAALAACLFAALFALPSGACCPSHPANGAFSTHLYAMWAAFVIASGLVAYFLTRVRRALDERGHGIARLRRRAEEIEPLRRAGHARRRHRARAGDAARHHRRARRARSTARPRPTPRRTPGPFPQQVARCRDILTRMQAGVAAPRAGRAPR